LRTSARTNRLKFWQAELALLLQELVKDGGWFMQIEMAWRDERVNIFALSGVSMGMRLEPQLFVCKKRPIGHRGPFVLDPRKGRPRFQLSQLGAAAQEQASRSEFHLSYVGEVDTYLHIPVNYGVFAGLCAEGWFALWSPSAPLSYFEDLQDGYLCDDARLTT